MTSNMEELNLNQAELIKIIEIKQKLIKIKMNSHKTIQVCSTSKEIQSSIMNTKDTKAQNYKLTPLVIGSILILTSSVFILPFKEVLADEVLATNSSDQVFYSNEAHEIKAIISKQELSRIIMPEDIEMINSIEGEIEYSVQDNNLYVRANKYNKPINLFIKTDDGITYKIILVVKDIAATQIFISKDHKNNSNNEDKKNDPYSKIISSIRDLNNDQIKEHQNIFEQLDQNPIFIDYESSDNNSKIYRLDTVNISEDKKKAIARIIDISLIPKRHIGYQIIKMNKRIKSERDDLAMLHIGRIKGTKIAADKIMLLNTSSSTVLINEEDFMGSSKKDTFNINTKKASNLTIYLNKKKLMPGEDAILIKVEEDE